MPFPGRNKVEDDEKWNDFQEAMPFFPVLEGWEVRTCPPFGGALMRLQLQKGDRHFSIYFDATNALGVVGAPYWEVYPMLDQDYLDDNGNPSEDASRYDKDNFRKMIIDIYEQVEDVDYLREKMPEFYV